MIQWQVSMTPKDKKTFLVQYALSDWLISWFVTFQSHNKHTYLWMLYYLSHQGIVYRQWRWGQLPLKTCRSLPTSSQTHVSYTCIYLIIDSYWTLTVSNRSAFSTHKDCTADATRGKSLCIIASHASKHRNG